MGCCFKAGLEVRVTLLRDSVCFVAPGPGLSIEVGDEGTCLVTLFQSQTQHSCNAGLVVLGGSTAAWSSPDSNSRVRRNTEGQAGGS